MKRNLQTLKLINFIKNLLDMLLLFSFCGTLENWAKIFKNSFILSNLLN